MSFLIVLLTVLYIYLYIRVSRTESFLKRKFGEDVFYGEKSSYSGQAQDNVVLSQKVDMVSGPAIEESPKQTYREQKHDSENPLRKEIDMERVFSWFANDWPMKLGALFVILGFGWFVGYAFVNDWIGPMGRIVLGLVAGALFLVWGEVRMRISKHQGVVLLVLGASTILVTVYAARELYDFFTPSIALMIMSLVTVFIAISSIKNKLLSLAHMSVVVGGIIPFLTVSHTPDMVGLFTYILILTTGAMAVVVYTGWRSVIATTLTIAVLYQLPFILDGGDGSIIGSLLYAGLFGVLFFVGNIAGIIHAKNATKADIYVAAVNWAAILGWIATTVPEAFRGLVTAGVGLFFTVGSFVVYKATRLKTPVAVYGGLALIMLGASTAFELNGPALTIAYILEISAVLAGIAYISKSSTSVRAISVLYILPIALSSGSIFASSWQNGVFHSDNVVLLLIVGVFAFLAVYMRTLQREMGGTYNAGIYAVVASVFGVVVVWLNAHALFSDDTASLIALSLYTVVGLYLYLSNAFEGKHAYRRAGKLLLMVVIARLLFVDVWIMDIVGRIITFLLIGALFMGSALIKKNLKLK